MKKIFSVLCGFLFLSSFADFYYWQGGNYDLGEVYYTYSTSPDPSSVSSVFGDVSWSENPADWGEDFPIIYYTNSGDFSSMDSSGYNDYLANGASWGSIYKPSSPEFADYPDPSSLPSSGGSGSVPDEGGFSAADDLISISSVLSDVAISLGVVLAACGLVYLAFLVWRYFRRSLRL